MTDPTSPAPSTSSVSAADRRRLRASHQMREHPTPTLKPGVWQLCRQDKREWPCMTIRLLDALEAAERALAASRAETAALADSADRFLAAVVDCDLVLGERRSPTVEGDLALQVYEDALEELQAALDAAAPTLGADGGAT